MKNKKIIPIYILLILFLFINIIMSNSSISNTYIYVIKPIIVLILTFITYYFTKGISNRNRKKYSKIQNILIFMFIYVFIYYLSGLIFGFVKNTYSLSFTGIIKNILSLLSVTILIEYIRYRIINYDRSKLSTIIITIICILLETSIIGITNTFDMFYYVLSIFIPIIIINITCSYLALKTSFYGVLIYKGIFSLITLFSPILVDLNPSLISLYYFFISTIIFYVINNEEYLENRKVSKRDIKNNYGLYLLFVIATIIVLFTLKIFKYYPVSVLSNSMDPYFSKGDMLIIEKYNGDNKLKIDDVIYYEHDNTYITHRIVDIDYTSDKYIYITKGDNNSDIDNWNVKDKEIKGIVRGHIKYLGWPSVYVYETLGGK